MTKLLDRQPFKALYLAYFATSLFLVKIPFWTILYIPRSRRIRRTWTLKRSLIVRIAKELFSVKVDLKPRNSANPLTEPGMTLKDAKFVWIDPIPNQMLVGEVRRVAEINGVQPVKVPGYWLLKKGSTWAGPKAKKGEKTLLHMHGGAFYLASANPSDVTANITRGLLQYSQVLERTLSVDYRLAASAPNPPANPFPAALLDTIAGYRYLVQEAGFEPHNIILIGDSAGGNLAVALIRHLLENPDPSLPLPGRLVVLSGWFDLATSRRGPDSSAVVNAPSDIFDTPPGVRFGTYGVTSLRGALDFEEVKTNPYLSPASPDVKPGVEGLFKGYPETYVVAGGAERLMDDSTVLVERMQADGVEVTSDIPPDAVHDFLSFTWHEPERTEVLRRLAKWIDGI